MERSEENRAISEVVERLSKSFPTLSSDQVEAAVENSRPEFEASPIRDFVPLFVERSAKHKLREIAGR
ncbi:MAG TPA: hypothetical protein VGJ44_10335 [Kribbellaceae bacterium]